MEHYTTVTSEFLLDYSNDMRPGGLQCCENKDTGRVSGFNMYFDNEYMLSLKGLDGPKKMAFSGCVGDCSPRVNECYPYYSFHLADETGLINHLKLSKLKFRFNNESGLLTQIKPKVHNLTRNEDISGSINICRGDFSQKLSDSDSRRQLEVVGKSMDIEHPLIGFEYTLRNTDGAIAAVYPVVNKLPINGMTVIADPIIGCKTSLTDETCILQNG